MATELFWTLTTGDIYYPNTMNQSYNEDEGEFQSYIIYTNVSSNNMTKND